MSEKDTVELTEFGLTVLQARAYVALLRIGEAMPSQVCLAMEIVRPEAYRVLRELEVKGLVHKNLGLPATYSPIDPKEALSVLIRRHAAELSSLEKKRESLAKALSCVTRLNNSIEERFSLISGGENAQLTVNRMIRDANTDYAAIVSSTGLQRISGDGWIKALASARRRSLQIRIIGEINNFNKKSARHLSRYAELRAGHDILFYMDIVDRAEMIFGPSFPTNDQELKTRKHDLWTNSRKFVQGMYAIFEKLWTNSTRYTR